MQTVPETLYAEAKELDKGKIPKPRMAIFNPTYNCNQNCYYCHSKEWNNKGSIEPSQRITEILEQLKGIGVQSLEFCGGGEPLMTPNIDKIFSEANEMGFRLGLLTNGVFFNGDIAETYLPIGNYVRVSIDTVNPETYEKIRGTKDLYVVIENLKKAVALKKAKRYKCDVSIKIGISKYTDIDSIKEVYRFFSGMGLDNIQVKNLWNNKGEHCRKDIGRQELMEISNQSSSHTVKKVVYPKYMTEQCWITPIQITVDVFGDVYLCCYNMYRKKSHLLGNLFETPLEELWGSDLHREKIKNIKISECLIHDCRFQKYMRTIRKLQKLGTWEFL